MLEGARAHEFDRYLAALLAPSDQRQDLLALAAFAGEIERVPLVVTEAPLGEIRLRWWIDWIDGLDRNERTGNPVADVMRDVVQRKSLPLDCLRDIVEARALELYDQPFEDDEAFNQFLNRTDGALFQLAHRIADETGGLGRHAPEALVLGRAYGGVRQLLRLPLLAARGRWTLSSGGADLVATNLNDPKVRQRADALRAAAIGAAQEELEEARSIAGGIIGEGRTAGLPAALVRPYLRALARQKDWLTSVADISPLARVWRLWRASRTGRF